MPQPGQVLRRGRLGQGGHPLLGVAGRARDRKDGDAVPGGMGEHAVDELGRLILFHCRSSSAAMPRDPSRVLCQRRRLPGQLPAHRLSLLLTSDRQARLTLQGAGNHLHPATGPGSDPWGRFPLFGFSCPAQWPSSAFPGRLVPHAACRRLSAIEFQR